ncbi:MAG: elongation factor P [Deltaproteobacteria bacterium]|nr:elongation factor P [Deltaproteobacteria bacterium]
MYDSNDLRKGLRVEIDGQPFIIVENQFVKPGKGQAFNRVKVKNLLNGNVIERTYKSSEKVKPANVLDKDMQFLYLMDNSYHFMDNKTYEQIELTSEQVGDNSKWLKEEMIVTVMIYNDNPVSISLPNFSVLRITHCEPGVRGDTATNVTKPATLETGAQINVPLFVNQDDLIKVDTRTGEYVERVKE